MIRDVRAVEIVCGGRCCEAAVTLKGKRRLMMQAEPLPLSECTMTAACRCRYQRYSDRREALDRRSPGSTLRGTFYGIAERRTISAWGRRPGDR